METNITVRTLCSMKYKVAK